MTHKGYTGRSQEHGLNARGIKTKDYKLIANGEVEKDKYPNMKWPRKCSNCEVVFDLATTITKKKHKGHNEYQRCPKCNEWTCIGFD
jgi:hypothetical protein